MLDTTVAEIRADGLIHARAPGSTHVVAEAGGKRATARITVYATPTNGMEFVLRPSEDALGYPRVATVIGTTTWTDTDGRAYTAEKMLTGGVLNIGKGIRGWEQRLEIETVVLIGGTQRRVVARDTIVDRGVTVYYNALDNLGEMWLQSDVSPGTQLHVHSLQPGRLIVPQKVGNAPSVDYLYVVK